MNISQKAIKQLSCVIIVVSLLLGSLCLAANAWVYQTTKDQMIEDVLTKKDRPTAIVLGAKVYANGGLSGMTKDRADTAIELYRQQSVTKILISGDHGQKTYDEVNTIKDYLLKQGIPARDIFLDHAGFDTYDSLYRARDIFQVKDAIIVTQDFHLPRAVFIANSLGMDTLGAKADRQDYGHMERVIIREKIAVLKAWADVLLQTKPQYLGEVIPITGPSEASWDEPQPDSN
jgi:SanA protein